MEDSIQTLAKIVLKKAVILLLSLLAFLPGRAQYLEVPKDKLDKPILFGSRILNVYNYGY